MESQNREQIFNSPEQEINSNLPQQKILKSNKQYFSEPLLLGIIIIILILSGLSVYVFESGKKQQLSEIKKLDTVLLVTQPSIGISREYEVLIRDNPQDKTKNDIYLIDKKNKKEIFYMTLSDLYSSHYHTAEFHNGNLYIIHRSGGNYGYQNNPDWMDSLWVYDKNKNGKKLYSNRGLDFRVSDNEQYIAIIGSGENNISGQNLIFLNSEGEILKKYSQELELQNGGLGFLFWFNNVLWVDVAFGPQPMSFIKIDVSNFSFKKYDLKKGLGVEYVLNPNNEKIVSSDFPPLFDKESADQFKKEKTKVSLSVYDLNKITSIEIATSEAKKFAPDWIDINTIEYNNPNGEGRVTKQIN